MKMRSRYAWGGAIAVLGIFVSLTPRFIFPVCEFTGKPFMHCSAIEEWERWVGLVILALGIVYLLPLPKWLRGVAGTCVSLAGAAVIWIPALVGYCPSPRMPCHYGTVPAMRILGGIVLVAGLAAAWAGIKKTRGVPAER